MTECAVRVLLDAHDNVAVQRAPEHHVRGEGRLLVWPTPGADSRAATCEDIRTALGLPFGQRGRPRTDVVASLLRDLRQRAVTEAYVLRAHRLKARTWSFLGEISAQVPMVLPMVVHQFAIARELRAALSAVGLVLGQPEVLEVGDQGLLFTPRRVWWASASSWQIPLPV